MQLTTSCQLLYILYLNSICVSRLNHTIRFDRDIYPFLRDEHALVSKKGKTNPSFSTKLSRK
jgi:hypothetical protein